MRPVIRDLVFCILRYSGIPFLLREIAQRDKVTAVVFHAPTVKRAEVYFQALRRRYNIIALADYLRARKNGAVVKLPSKSLIITLDDGHANNFDLKALLERWRLPVSIFLCSGIVGTNRHYWWTHTRSASETEECKQMKNADRLRFLESRDYRPDQQYSDRQALSRSEIAQLKPLVDFQAHTVTHPILTACPPEEARREIAECRTNLEQEYRLNVYALAFPNGNASDRDVTLARAAGYACALTLDSGSNDADTDLFRLKRIPLRDDGSVSELLVKTSGLWDRFGTARNSVKRVAKLCGSRRKAPLPQAEHAVP